MRFAQLAILFLCVTPLESDAIELINDLVAAKPVYDHRERQVLSAAQRVEESGGMEAATSPSEVERISLKMSTTLASHAVAIYPAALTRPPPPATPHAEEMAPGTPSTVRATLLDAVLKGLVRHPDVRAAQADAQRAEAELGISRSSYLPRVEMSAGPESGSSGKPGYNVTVSQMVYDWGKVAGSVDAASAGLRQKIYELALVRERVAMDIIDICLNLFAAHKRLQAAENYRQRIYALYARTDLRSRDGYSDASEHSRAGLTLARAAEQIDIEQGQLQEAEAQYRFLVGEPYSSGFNLLPDDVEVGDLVRFERMNAAISESPAFMKAVEEVEMAEARVRNARAALLPELRLEGSAIRREIGGTITSDSLIALRLHMTPFQGNSNLLKVDAERQRLEAARWSRDNLELETRRKLSTLSEKLRTLRARAVSLGTQRLQAMKLRELYEDQFQMAMREVNDLLIVETEWLESERQLVDARVGHLRAQFQAAAQVGTLLGVLQGRIDSHGKIILPQK